jgi:hypothetical protein
MIDGCCPTDSVLQITRKEGTCVQKACHWHLACCFIIEDIHLLAIISYLDPKNSVPYGLNTWKLAKMKRLAIGGGVVPHEECQSRLWLVCSMPVDSLWFSQLHLCLSHLYGTLPLVQKFPDRLTPSQHICMQTSNTHQVYPNETTYKKEFTLVFLQNLHQFQKQ